MEKHITSNEITSSVYIKKGKKEFYSNLNTNVLNPF